MQLVREIPDGLCERDGALLKRRDGSVNLLLRTRLADLALEATQHDAEAAELLTQVVVQVAGDAGPLGVLRFDQPAGQVLDLLITCFQHDAGLTNPVFSLLAFGDVDAAADVTVKAAVDAVLRNARRQHPSVRAIGSAETEFKQEGSPRLEGRDVDAHAGLYVLRMDEAQPAFVQQLFERDSRELHTEGVYEVEPRVCSGRP